MKTHPNIDSVAAAGRLFGLNLGQLLEETAYDRILKEIEARGFNKFYDAADVFTDQALTAWRKVDRINMRELSPAEFGMGIVAEAIHAGTYRDIGFYKTLGRMVRYERAEERRFQLRGAIATNQVNGKLYLEESGMDCDGVRYSGQIHEIDATLEAYTKFVDDTNAWADGPCYLNIIPPAELEAARLVGYQSRDLGSEAHEDGHPHSIHG